MEEPGSTTIEEFLKSFPPYSRVVKSLDRLTFKEYLDVANEDFIGSVNGNLHVSVCPSTVVHNKEMQNCLLLKYCCAVQIEGVEYGKILRALIQPKTLQTLAQSQITLKYAMGDKVQYYYGDLMTFQNDRYSVEKFESDSPLNLFEVIKWKKTQPIVDGNNTLTEGSLIIFAHLLSKKWHNKSTFNLKFIDTVAEIWDLKCERSNTKTSRIEAKCTKTLQDREETDTFTYRLSKRRLENLIRWKKTGSEIVGGLQINKLIETQRLNTSKAQVPILPPPNEVTTSPTDADSNPDFVKKRIQNTQGKPEWGAVFPHRLFANLSFMNFHQRLHAPKENIQKPGHKWVVYRSRSESPDRKTNKPTAELNSKTPQHQRQMCSVVAAFCKLEDIQSDKDLVKSPVEESEVDDMQLNFLFEGEPQITPENTLDESNTMAAKLQESDIADDLSLNPVSEENQYTPNTATDEPIMEAKLPESNIDDDLTSNNLFGGSDENQFTPNTAVVEPTVTDAKLQETDTDEDLHIGSLFDEEVQFAESQSSNLAAADESSSIATKIQTVVESHKTPIAETKSDPRGTRAKDFDSIMSEAQKMVKMKTFDYIQRHPELKTQLSSYLSKVIKEQPEDLHSFAAGFFTTSLNE